MPALNFQPQFLDKILSGEKVTTIRKPRKRPIKVSEKLYLYTGLRTKSCKKIMETHCIKMNKFYITRNVNHEYQDWNQIAKNDGFESWDKLCDWFENQYGLPFEGVLIEWGELNVCIDKELL